MNHMTYPTRGSWAAGGGCSEDGVTGAEVTLLVGLPGAAWPDSGSQGARCTGQSRAARAKLPSVPLAVAFTTTRHVRQLPF
jgi:hypothetical protein